MALCYFIIFLSFLGCTLQACEIPSHEIKPMPHYGESVES